MALVARLQLFALVPTGMTRREYRMGRRFFALASPRRELPPRTFTRRGWHFMARNRRASSAMRRLATPGSGGHRPAHTPTLRFRTTDPEAPEVGREPPISVDDARRALAAAPVAARELAPRPRGCPTHSARCAGVDARPPQGEMATNVSVPAAGRPGPTSRIAPHGFHRPAAASVTAGLRPSRRDERPRLVFHASFPPRNPCPRLCA
jgi:hypothetical protein